ncbi:hypothetical protein [Robertkochia flava]|uniref:hypothetical protein n=1 Tax=Robertkochia flava TaxID=3447986 RepID=UPI001CCB2D1F|nr:hypothetical protein [Robertkochia marina]
MTTDDRQHLYIQLIMKKLLLETKGEISCRSYCNPFKMRVHLQGILGQHYSSEDYHIALELIMKYKLARFGGMYITEKGVKYVERITLLEHTGLLLNQEDTLNLIQRSMDTIEHPAKNRE